MSIGHSNNQIIIDEFFRYVEGKFNFLTSNYGYKRAVIKLDDITGIIYIFFTGQTNVIQVVIDPYGEAVYCKVAKLETMQSVDSPFVDKNETETSQGICDLLKKYGVGSELLSPTTKSFFSENFKITVDDYASMIQNYITLVLYRFSSMDLSS